MFGYNINESHALEVKISFHCQLLPCEKYLSTKDLSVLPRVREDKK